MKLYEGFPESVVIDGITYRLNLSFDRVLRYFELFGEPELNAEDITDIGYSWLVIKPQNVPLVVKSAVLAHIRGEILSPPCRSLHTQKKQPKAVDFSYDAEKIYSSFMQAYGIDLIKMRGKMHWCSFIALFRGLPDDTPIKRIMNIRTKEIPVPTKSNAKYIQNLAELKTLYALPAECSEGEMQDKQDNLNNLFDFLLAKAGE